MRVVASHANEDSTETHLNMSKKAQAYIKVMQTKTILNLKQNKC